MRGSHSCRAKPQDIGLPHDVTGEWRVITKGKYNEKVSICYVSAVHHHRWCFG